MEIAKQLPPECTAGLLRESGGWSRPIERVNQHRVLEGGGRIEQGGNGMEQRWGREDCGSGPGGGRIG